MRQLANQQINKSTNQQINKSTNQQINKSTNQQIGKSANQQIKLIYFILFLNNLLYLHPEYVNYLYEENGNYGLRLNIYGLCTAT